MDDFERLVRLLRDELHQPDLRLTPQTQARDVDGWDSMRHLQIILRIEREFGMRFATRDILGAQNVGELYALITAAVKK